MFQVMHIVSQFYRPSNQQKLVQKTATEREVQTNKSLFLSRSLSQQGVILQWRLKVINLRELPDSQSMNSSLTMLIETFRCVISGRALAAQ